MPRPRKFPDTVVLRIPVYEPPQSVLELLFEGKTLELAKSIVNYLKKNNILWKDAYREELGLKDSDAILYFRVIKKMLALGLLREDRGYYKLSDKFCARLENLIRMWKFEIGNLKDLW